MLSSCTQEANTPSTSETTLAATLQVENDPEFAELMTALKDETQSRRVLKQNCRCFIKVNSATNVGSASYNTWGLSDITYDENQPEFEIDGAEGAWLLQGVSYSLPSPYFELSTPSSGLHQLQLIQSNFNLDANTNLNVSVVCLDNGALANSYNFDMVFYDADDYPYLGLEDYLAVFNYYFSCDDTPASEY